MKILQLIQKPQLRGAEIFACQLSNHLNQLGHESKVVSIFSGDAALPFDGAHIKLSRPVSKRLWDYAGLKQLADVIRHENPDVIQANAGDTLKYAVFSKLLFRWKTPIVFRNASTVSLYIKNPVTKSFNQWLYRFTKHIISVSNHTKNDLLELFPSLKGKVVVIPIGIERSVLLPTPKKENSVVHVGGFSFEKNHKGLIQIFAKLITYIPTATLTLVGDGVLRKQVEALVDELGLDDHVYFKGYCEHPLTFIQEANVLVLPSIIEGLPAVILEAFYCKVPVVAYNVGGIKDVLQDGVTGMLIEKGNVDMFCNAIKNILNNPSSYHESVELAYNKVTKEFSNDVIAQDFEKIYEAVISSTRKLNL